MADSWKISCADVSTVLLAQERRSLQKVTQSDLLPDWITLSPLDFAGEYMALETSPNIQGLHFKPVVVLLWTKSQYSYDPLFRGHPVGQSEQPHRAKSVDLRGGMCFTGSDTYSPPHSDLR